MPDFDDEELRDEVNNALDDDQIDDDAEHDQDDIADDDSPEEDDDAEAEEDEDDESDDRPAKKKSSRSAPADDDESEDDDDDQSLDYARPEFKAPGSVQVKEFDIRTLPKDPETGLIDPVEANRLINEHYANQGQANQQAQAQLEKTTQLLTQQWTRVSKKYPAVYQNPRLRDVARDMHLNSIGTDNYLTPAQAASKVEKLRREAVKSGYKSAKTRRSVEKMTRTERNSGRSSDTKVTGYEKAKKMAASRDPAKAKQGRMEMLRIRRAAQKRG